MNLRRNRLLIIAKNNSPVHLHIGATEVYSYNKVLFRASGFCIQNDTGESPKYQADQEKPHIKEYMASSIILQILSVLLYC